MTSHNPQTLPEGAYTDFHRGGLSYGEYLAIDELMALQRPVSAEHDEMLFIIIHQASELWIRLMLHELHAAIAAIREAIPAMARQIPGYDMADAVLTGVETRTSSPIRITRGEDFQSLNTRGLFPAGEGAGFAGGILSAGVDGIKVAEAVARDMLAMPEDKSPAVKHKVRAS